MNRLFKEADILIPRTSNPEKWAVIACDQFTSDKAYWQRVRDAVGQAPSTLNMIIPESDLGSINEDERIKEINATMKNYLKEGVFDEYKNSYVYVERTMENGAVRPGLLGVVDLEQYDYSPDSEAMIHATEKTVVERIPPRVRVRKDAVLEFPHVIMLCDDYEKRIVETAAKNARRMKVLYDFDLIENGGHICGRLVDAETAREINEQFKKYCDTMEERYRGADGKPFLFAIGDGNHSLATAKTCYENLKAQGADTGALELARYSLVELENIHDPSIVFEPIHRIIFGADIEKLLAELRDKCCADTGFEIEWIAGSRRGRLTLDEKKGKLAVAVLQHFLDDYLSENAGEIDYIHDDPALIELAGGEDAIGFLLPPMGKGQLFLGVMADGVLPRKTFSMGHSREKRYYLEGRRIR